MALATPIKMIGFYQNESVVYTQRGGGLRCRCYRYSAGLGS